MTSEEGHVKKGRLFRIQHVSNIVYFSSLFGEDSHVDEHIFQTGWFNHQLDLVVTLFEQLVAKQLD